MTSLKMIIMIARDWRDWWPISGVGSWSAFSLISPLINLQVLSLVIEYDVNGNGKLDFDEFMEMMRKQVQWIQQMRKKRGYQKYNIERPRFNFQAEHQDNSAELREAFKIFDRLDSLMFLRNGKVKWFSPQGWKRVHWCCRIEKGTRLNLLLCAKNTYNLSMFPLHPSKKILFVQSALFGDVFSKATLSNNVRVCICSVERLSDDEHSWENLLAWKTAKPRDTCVLSRETTLHCKRKRRGGERVSVFYQEEKHCEPATNATTSMFD